MHFPKLTTIGLALLLAGRAAAQQIPQLHYTISMDDPASHKFHVVFECKGLDGPVLDFKMPAWMPGYYQLLDYAKKVEDFHAWNGADPANSVNPERHAGPGHGASKELGWEKTSPNTWRVAHAPHAVLTLTYDVMATTAFVAQPWLDSTRGYISPAGVFLYIDGHLKLPVTVEVKPWSGWNKVATGLEAAHEKAAGPSIAKSHVFYAPDFDILYDSPILMGNLEELPTFMVKGVPHYFTGYHLGEFDRAAFAEDLKKVVEQGVAVIGDLPYKHYTFLATGAGRGGIEHLNSTTVGFSGEVLKTKEGRQKVMCFLAHEYFHHYNVKRIRPIGLGPFDYQRENRTDQLWVSEGLTVYYEYLLVRRAGLMSGEDLLHHFQQDIAAYENKPGHLYQSLAQASHETWSDGPFGRTGDSINKTISYYQKGPAVGLLLDLAIRHSTQNRKSLDDVMQTVYKVYYLGKKRGFTGAEFREACESVAGVALPELFDYVYTVKEPDYAKYLAYGGLGIDMEVRRSPNEEKPENAPGERSFRIYLLPQPDALQLAIRKDWLRE